jgi:putative selenium metabolism hydrolase
MNFERMIAFAQALVRARSLSGQEAAAAQLVLAEMRALGYDQAGIDENGSVVGIIEGRQPGATLLLDAHCDTVDVLPGSRWTHDPFGGKIGDGCLHGRGAADMKGALAAMVHAAAAVEREALAGRVAVSATVMEEVLEGASLQAVCEAVRPSFVVVGEATRLNLNRGGRGRAEIHLETIGRPAHSSSPQLGINAVHSMLPIVQAIEQIELPADPVMGPAILALTDIISHPYPGYSVIPARCRVTYDRRLLPGETPEDVLGPILALPPAAGADFHAAIPDGDYQAYTGKAMRGTKFFPAWILPEDDPFVQAALHGLHMVGLRPTIGAYAFCTNAAYSAGIAGIPTVGFGPAAEGDAHVTDERIALEALAQAARGYQGIIRAVLPNA